MANKYTNERNAQIVINLLKEHGIKRIIASPGTTNIAFVASVQQDPFFKIYSAPDERSAAYMACGMAEESGEPVVLSCTGATASRNYYPGLTEAFYRKLPIVAITSSRQNYYIGQNNDQVTDRTAIPNDIATISVQLPLVHDVDSEWACVIRTNKAMHFLRKHGGGPVHINLETKYSSDFSVDKIPPVRSIQYYSEESALPDINYPEVGILVGSHSAWSKELTQAVDLFCEKYNGVVICDHISNYRGKYAVNNGLASLQLNYKSVVSSIPLIIHIGGITSTVYKVEPQSVWRVSEDGEIRDTYRKIRAVFEMCELRFFEYYNGLTAQNDKKNSLYLKLKEEEGRIAKKVPELPFSNAWVACKFGEKLPADSVLHLGIRNSLRMWSFFDIPSSVNAYSNVGGFGIDGSLSSVLGASLASPNKLFYCVLGDLAFFYDMNALGNRHFGNNVRILVFNNATGMEMNFSGFYADKINAEKFEYISASHHYGNQSRELVKNYAHALGFKYILARGKDDFDEKAKIFFSDKNRDESYVFEVFTKPEDEDRAYVLLSNLESSLTGDVKSSIKKIIGDKGVQDLKKLLKKHD